MGCYIYIHTYIHCLCTMARRGEKQPIQWLAHSKVHHSDSDFRTCELSPARAGEPPYGGRSVPRRLHSEGHRISKESGHGIIGDSNGRSEAWSQTFCFDMGVNPKIGLPQNGW